MGCSVPVCRTKCPALEDPVCPLCFVEETFINGSLCGCEQQRCIKKSCSPPQKLDPAKYPCHVITKSFDGCGCAINKPEKGPYCIPINKKAKEAVCTDAKLPAKCFVNVVNEKTDECGCDTNECARKKEECANEYETDACPKGHLMAKGLTPCGSPRQACVKCPKVKVDEKNCPKSCGKIEESTDFHGCPKKTCAKNPCPACLGVEGSGVDACGCKVCIKTRTMEVLVQKRSNLDSTNFDKDWNSYENGFTVGTSFWLGLKSMLEISQVYKGKCQLVFESKRKDNGNWEKLVLDGFYLDADGKYTLRYGDIVEGPKGMDKHFGTYFRNRPFTTKDRDNDSHKTENCAAYYKGGWWAGSCHRFCVNCNQYHWRSGSGSAWVAITETRIWIRIKA